MTPAFFNNDLVWHTHTLTFVANAPLITLGFRLISEQQGFAGVGVIDNFKLTSVLSTDNFVKVQSVILPNPIETTARLKTDKNITEGTLLIYNAYGQLLQKTDRLNGDDFQIDRKNWPIGIYYLQVIEGNRIIVNQKLMVN